MPHVPLATSLAAVHRVPWCQSFWGLRGWRVSPGLPGCCRGGVLGMPGCCWGCCRSPKCSGTLPSLSPPATTTPSQYSNLTLSQETPPANLVYTLISPPQQGDLFITRWTYVKRNRLFWRLISLSIFHQFATQWVSDTCWCNKAREFIRLHQRSWHSYCFI